MRYLRINAGVHQLSEKIPFFKSGQSMRVDDGILIFFSGIRTFSFLNVKDDIFVITLRRIFIGPSPNYRFSCLFVGLPVHRL